MTPSNPTQRTEPGPAWELSPPRVDCSLIEPGLARTLAHDLRSPLTVINLSVEMLGACKDEARQQRYAQAIAEQARAISWALENLLTLADDDVWRSVSLVQVDLRTVTERCVEEVQGAAQAREITVKLVPGGAAPVEGAADALHQAVRGCLQAVIMAAPAGGEVSVELVEDRAGEQGRVVVRISATGELEGVGVQPLPWHRLSLRAAAHLIACHGGVVSPASAGTGVTIVLPRRAALSGEKAA